MGGNIADIDFFEGGVSQILLLCIGKLCSTEIKHHLIMNFKTHTIYFMIYSDSIVFKEHIMSPAVALMVKCEGHITLRSIKWMENPIARCPWQTFQSGGIKIWWYINWFSQWQMLIIHLEWNQTEDRVTQNVSVRIWNLDQSCLSYLNKLMVHAGCVGVPRFLVVFTW